MDSLEKAVEEEEEEEEYRLKKRTFTMKTGLPVSIMMFTVIAWMLDVGVRVRAVAVPRPVQTPGRAPCEHRGRLHQHGAHWDPSSCSHCQCVNGFPACYAIECFPAVSKCVDPVHVPGICCPVCPRGESQCRKVFAYMCDPA